MTGSNLSLPKKRKPPYALEASIVAGPRHITQGKYPVELRSLDNHRKSSTSSILIAESMPSLIQSFEPNAKEFRNFLNLYQSHHFTEISTPQVALITEITLD
jgi:hypothetical protein